MPNEEMVLIYNKEGKSAAVPKSKINRDDVLAQGFTFEPPQSAQSSDSGIHQTANPDYQASGSIQPSGQNQEQDNSQTVQEMQQKFAPTLSESIAKRPDLQKTINAIKPIAEGAGNFLGGAAVGGAQGLLNNASSIYNLGPDTVNLVAGTNIPRMQPTDLSQYAPEGMAGSAGYDVGDFTGQLAGGGAAFKAAKYIPKLSNEASVLANAARGAISGFATGDEAPGGRFAAAGLGAAGGVGTNMTNKSLADTLLKQYKGVQNKYSQAFKSLFENTPGEITPIKDYGVVVPDNLKLASVKKDLTSPEKKIINDYKKNPTFENAHYAQSLLGQYIEPLKKSRAKDRGAFKKVGELNAATKAYNSLKSGINNALETIDDVSGHDIYSNNYKALKEGYEKEVTPYFGNKLEEYDANSVGAKDVVKSVLKDKNFMEYEKKGNRIIPGPGSKNSMLKAKSMANNLLGNKYAKWGAKSLGTAAGVGLGGYGVDRQRQYYGNNLDQ